MMKKIDKNSCSYGAYIVVEWEQDTGVEVWQLGFQEGGPGKLSILYNHLD
jgi:hypothetical protein